MNNYNQNKVMIVWLYSGSKDTGSIKEEDMLGFSKSKVYRHGIIFIIGIDSKNPVSKKNENIARKQLKDIIY